MKVTIEYNLPEEQEDFEMAANAGSYLTAINHFSEYLRNHYKYKHEEEWPDLEEIRSKFHSILVENGL